MWSIAVNFIIGLLMLLPFPGWSQLIGFISSAAILSLAFGPVITDANAWTLGAFPEK